VSHPNTVPELSVHDLARALEAGEDIQIVDVRAPERVRQGPIDLAPPGRFHNIRGSELITPLSLAGTSIELIVVAFPVAGWGGPSADETPVLSVERCLFQQDQGMPVVPALFGTVQYRTVPPSRLD